MKKRGSLLLIILLMVIGSMQIVAQRFEITPFGGIRVGGRFNLDTLPPTQLNLKDSITYGLSLGVFLTENYQVEIMWSRQDTKLFSDVEIIGFPSRELFKLYVDQWHINFMFVHGDETFRVRPFGLVGLGWTYFNPRNNLGGESRFSFALGGGVRVYASDRFGMRFQVKYNPTYITSTGSVFFDPWYGYIIVPYARYIHQWEFTFGLIIRM